MSLTFIFVGTLTFEMNQKEVEGNIKNVAKILSKTARIGNALKEKDAERLEKYVGGLLEGLDNVQVITIADMEGTRYFHPEKARVGQKFVGGDEKRVLNGESYISEAKGTMGMSIRAFEPIIYRKEQVGFIMVGVLVENLLDYRTKALKSMIGFTIFGITLGVMGAIFISNNIKKALLGLEPKEIAYLYKEKKAMLKTMQGGILAIDSNGIITLFNDYAIEVLDLKESNVVGKHILDVFPSSKLLEVLEDGKPRFRNEETVNHKTVISNRIQIKDGDQVLGAIATFYDKTRVKRLAEEITGVKQVVDALRANTHEFMNKLHLIQGLIELNELDEVRRYITGIVDEQEKIRFFLMKKIKNPIISALILGKLSRAKELNIEVEISQICRLEKFYKGIQNETLVTILGNLLENSMEAISQSEISGEIFLRIEDVEEAIEIEVIDNGEGISEENMDKIFQRGFTTKGKERDGGVGLYLVKQSVDSLGGSMFVESQVSEGTSFFISIPKEDEVG